MQWNTLQTDETKKNFALFGTDVHMMMNNVLFMTKNCINQCDKNTIKLPAVTYIGVYISALKDPTKSNWYELMVYNFDPLPAYNKRSFFIPGFLYNL